MTASLRSKTLQYCETIERSVRKYVRDQAVLSEEIMSLLETYDTLTCERLSLMIGADSRLLEQVLEDLMNVGLITRVARLDSRERAHYFWSASHGNRLRLSDARTLAASQSTGGDRL
ncbi:hypothetical protein AWB78_08458 [Caballeronia calidae]|uniref:MarR family transcriptional regulator n=1 Tax=Caballeronia calidae TaxID=1777139 RepID=A0A158EML5_9BURK|nr:hypothetical protein [Caballeronia calidae]SAL07177.1 hypothetical protein AWB78_08458 [Caballeronia calidae]